MQWWVEELPSLLLSCSYIIESSAKVCRYSRKGGQNYQKQGSCWTSDLGFPFGRCTRTKELVTDLAVWLIGSWFIASCFEHTRPSIISTTPQETAESIGHWPVHPPPDFYGKKCRIRLWGYGEIDRFSWAVISIHRIPAWVFTGRNGFVSVLWRHFWGYYSYWSLAVRPSAFSICRELFLMWSAVAGILSFAFQLLSTLCLLILIKFTLILAH